jgi:peptidoglycan hydrolase-like protein with peptidoglycan-binding domain
MNPKQADDCLRPGLASNAGLNLGRGFRRARTLALASVLAAAPIVAGFPQISAEAKTHPVVSQRHEVSFVGSSVASLRAAKGGASSAPSPSRAPDPITTARAGAVTPVQQVTGAVTVVGVTWPKGAVSAKDEFQIRTLKAATWGQWESLDVEDAHGPDRKEAAPATTTGTSPYVITDASQFEVRSLTTKSIAPEGAKVQVVNPGESAADSAQPALGSAAAAAAKPAIYTRAAWGADERLRKGVPSYGRVQVGFVHHTDSPNTYAASQVPAMIRGIYAYHVQSQGWSDIGYNFIIDRFGRTWEGRFGGMDKAVTGAQTLNYNAVSMGVSALGNFETSAVPAAMTAAFKRIFAWKFSLSGIPATGSVVANGKSFPRVAGHRDGFQTACPGKYLYAKLAEIRAGTAAIMRAPAPKPVVKPVVKPAPALSAIAQAAAKTRFTSSKAVVLRQRSRGRAVAILQGGLKMAPSGVFGASTRTAVVAYQVRQRLPRTGVVGRAEWNRIELGYYPLVNYRALTLRPGSHGATVAIVQRVLKLTPDGLYGPKTATAVAAVQRSVRLAQTGWVRDWTWVTLENKMKRG